MRKCSKCGLDVVLTPTMILWGYKHGKDFAVWPTKCPACILDATINLFDEVDPPLVTPPEELPQPSCVACGGALGPKFYQAVPGHGDLCLPCHEQFKKDLLPL
jgi:hypothetical protein